MKTKMIACMVAAAAALASFGASAQKGSCPSKAISLKSSQTATLVNEYDPEEKEFYDTGALYYKMTLKRGVAYTVWITGGNASAIDLDVDTDWDYYEDREDEPGAGFSIDEIDGGATKVAYLYADDWDTDPEDGDPKSGRYQVSLIGNIGDSTTLGFQMGIKTFTVIGSEESPKVISFSTSRKTYASRLVDGEFYFRASLKAGTKYRIRTVGGTAANSLVLSVDGLVDGSDSGESTDTARLVDANNDALVLVPDTSGKYEIVVSGSGSQSFKLQYEMVPKRGIAAHPTIPLVEENGYTAKFVPGRIADTHNYYDEIIDEHLCRIYLNKGERWVFETDGATNSIQMVAYDPSGSVLVVNDSSDGESYDTRVVVTASKSGVYYVGVCDPLLDVGDVPNGAAVVLTARNTAGFPAPDAYDPADDVYATASMVVPYPAPTNVMAVAYTKERSDAEALGAIHGPHRFGASDLYDVFSFQCRKGFTYALRAEFADTNDVTKITLGAKLFNLNAGKERNVAYSGTVSPAYGEYAADGDLTFKAAVDGTHYLRVWVADGKGLDFPAYNLHAICVNGENPLGLVRVVSRGVPGGWTLNAEKTVYPSGATLVVGKSDALKVNAAAVAGFKASASKTVKVPQWTEGGDVVVVTNIYSDLYDFKYQTGTKTVKGKKQPVYSPETGDNTPAGAFAITPAASAATLKRTLWTADPADYFVFTATANVYYNFSVANTLEGGAGDAVIVISNAVSGAVLYKNVAEVSRALLPAGKTYVIVAHGTAGKADSAYTLTYSRAAGGTVRFTNAKGTAAVSSYTVSEGAAAATLYVQRTGTEGAVRVRYATQAGTALPGTNYYPIATNEISWAAGNKAVKAIKVNLIPDAEAHWEPSGKTFKVRLYPVDEYDLAAGEYLSIIPADTATVTIKETSAKKPGTVSLAECDGTAVANVKKPAVSGKAGGTVTLSFSRTGGADGPVSVKVASPTPAVAKKNKDTAVSGTDYAPFDATLEWADGETDDKQVVINLMDSNGYMASKKFVFTIEAVKTDGTLPTLSAKTATMTIFNDTVAQTAAAYAKTIPASTGAKLTSTGTWFKDYDGTFRSGSANGTLVYTLTGPGLFACEPEIVATNEGASAALKCQIVNKTAKLNEQVTNFDERFVRILPAGATTVTFTLSGVRGGAFVQFRPQANGEPYEWTKFALVEPLWPMANAVVINTNLSELAWTMPAALSEETNLYCRVRYGTAAKPTEVVAYDATRAFKAKLPAELAAGQVRYWALDYAYTDQPSPTPTDLESLKWTAGPSTWKFSTLAAGAPVTSIGSTCVDAAGNIVADLVAAGEPVELIQCVQPDFDLDGDGDGETPLSANGFRLVGGSLPKGLTVNATSGVLDGAPSTPGTYTALLQSYAQKQTGTKKVNGKKQPVYSYVYGTTIPVKFNVLPAGTMMGTFRGTLREANGDFATDARQSGVLTLSVTSAGKITAKATIGGIAYTFTSPKGSEGYSELLDRDETSSGCTRHVQVTLKTTVKTLNSKKKVTGTYTENFLTLTLGDGPLTNAVALAEAVGTAELTLNVLNSAKTAVTPDVMYTANLYRSNGGAELGAVALGRFVGYYTSAQVPEGVSAADGVPVGNGYLTFTVASSAAVKVSGVLADGTSVSFSTIGQLVGDTLEKPEECRLMVPVYAGNATYALGGEVEIAFPAGGEYPVLQPASKLAWARNAAKLTSRDGTAFAISLAPTGGWYDKVVNLQNHYLNNEFAVSTIGSADELPPEALAKGYSFSTLSTPNDLAASFTGNTLSVPGRSLVKNKTTGLYDFGTSVNPWNTTVKFVRATGLVSGTFNAWEWVVKSDLLNEYNSAQKQMSSLAHKGVLLYTRDDSSESPLSPDVLTAGFFLMPATTSTKAKDRNAAWKASLPFNILTVDDNEKDWDEKDFE